MRFARFARQAFQQDDPSKRGFVMVEYDGQVVRAYPYSPAMMLMVPSQEWVEKYRDAVWALITPFEDRPSDWCWCGVALLSNPDIDDAFFTEYLEDYPHFRMIFTENWKIGLNDTIERNTFRIQHEDGTVILIDRTTDEEKIQVLDGVHGHEVLLDPEVIKITHGKTGAVITLEEDGRITIVSPDEVTINSQAKTVVNAQDDVEVNAEGKILLNAGERIAVLITGQSVDPFTRAFHIDASRSVEATK